MISDASVKMITDTIQTIFMIGCPLIFFLLVAITLMEAWPWQNRK
jgi:hypothetical protein